jgi:hypothetical protein
LQERPSRREGELHQKPLDTKEIMRGKSNTLPTTIYRKIRFYHVQLLLYALPLIFPYGSYIGILQVELRDQAALTPETAGTKQSTQFLVALHLAGLARLDHLPPAPLQLIKIFEKF